jgi:endoglucanase
VGFIITTVSNLVFNSYSAQASVNGSTVTFTYTKPEETPAVDSAVTAQIENNGVTAHGQLKVSGTQLVDKNGSPVVLKGMSSHGLVWYPQFTNEYTINKTKQYGANVYRAAMYTEEYGGYTTGADFQNTAKELAYKAVDTAVSLDMYAILDWHILSDNTPLKHKDEAIAFFDEASKRYSNNPAVIYEICNEPNNTSWSSDIKPYANEVIPVIRKNSPNAIILVGTNTWSQDVDEASKDKLAFDNIMYTFHFYAGTHSLDAFKNKIETALSNGCAVFVSEWGTTKADGSNGVYPEESTKWLEYLKEKNISRINWSLADKDESSAAFKPNTNCESFGYDDLTESGKFAFDSLSKY